MSEEKKQDQANLVEDENLDEVAGGAIFHAPERVAGDKEHRWEVLDDKSGNVLGRFGTKKEAKDYCEHNRISTNRIFRFSRVEKMRDAYQQHQKYYEDDPNWKNPYGVE